MLSRRPSTERSRPVSGALALCTSRSSAAFFCAASTVSCSDASSVGTITSAAASGSPWEIAAASCRTADSGDPAPPFPTTAVTANVPTNTSAATPVAAMTEPKRPRVRRAGSGSSVANGIEGSSRSSVAPGAPSMTSNDDVRVAASMTASNPRGVPRFASAFSRSCSSLTARLLRELGPQTPAGAHERDPRVAVRHADDVGRVGDLRTFDFDQEEQRAHVRL